MPKSIFQANAEAPATILDQQKLAEVNQRLSDNLATLKQISTASTMTNAQLLNAVKFLAANQLAVMQFVSRRFTPE